MDLLKLTWDKINSKVDREIDFKIPYQYDDKDVQESREGTCRRH